MSPSDYLLWAQLFVLLVTAFLVWRYVRSTEEIKQAAVRQAALTGDQIEAMSRPVLVPGKVGIDRLHLTNVGSGSALQVEWWPCSQNEPFAAPEVAPHGQMGLIEVKGQSGMIGAPSFAILKGNSQKIVCRYRSVSGRTYLSQGVPREDPTSGQWFDTETVELR